MEIVLFILNSVLFGVGLAMDAFSVSLANGLHEPKMTFKRVCLIAGTFGVFQFLMPMIGWVCLHTIADYFLAFRRWIPWIALVLLAIMGGKMLIEGIRGDESQELTDAVGKKGLFVQGIATSIDALSVGLTITDYTWQQALGESLIIGAITFVICVAGLFLGKKIGVRIAGKASILGGVILILIGLEIFLTA